MANAPFAAILGYFRPRRKAASGAELTDSQLLARFARGRDEAAFATLVGRHGPLVMGVCRRVLRNAADAEDAFQATFLVLSRRAGTVAWRSSVGNWLHETAYRLARKHRAADCRRQARERELAPRTVGASSVAPAWRELCDLLDDELRRLPWRERSALLACYLEDRTQDEAARQLGWSLRTLQRRLAQGRELLRARLVRHGLPLPAAFLAGTLVHDALASGTAAEMARAAAVFASGGSPAVRAAATALAAGSLRAGARAMLRLVVACLVLSGVGLVGVRRVSTLWEDVEGAQANASPGTPIARQLVDAEGDPLPEGTVTRLGTLRLRHTRAVTAVAFTPDGRGVVAGDEGGNFILWDVESGWPIRRLRTAPRDPVDAVPVAVSPDAGTLAWAAEGRVQVADADDAGNPVSWPAENTGISALTLSPGGQTLAIDYGGGATQSLALYDARTGQKHGDIFSFEDSGLAERVFSPDGKTLAYTSQAGATVRLFDVASGEELRTLGAGLAVTDRIAFAPDGKTIVTLSLPTTGAVYSPDGNGIVAPARGAAAVFWDVATGREMRRANRAGNLQCPAYFPGGKVLADVEDGRLTFRDAASDAKLGESDLTPAQRLVVSPDGKTVATLRDESQTFDLWDAPTARPRSFPGQSIAVGSLAFSNDGQVLVSARGRRPWGFANEFGPSDRLRRWNPLTGREVETAADLYSFDAVSADGRTCVGFRQDPNAGRSALCVWEAATGKELGRLDDVPDSPQTLALSADGKVLLERPFNRRIARLWDVRGQKLLCDLDVDQDLLAPVVLSPGGSVIAAGGYRDGVVRRWSTHTGKELPPLKTPHRMVFSLTFGRGGKLLATGGPYQPIYLWDTATGEQLQQIDGLGPRIVPHLELSADASKLLASGGGKAALWSVETGAELTRFEGHDCPITAAALSPDGRLAATAGQDTTVLVWDLTGGPPASRELSRDELERLWTDLADADARKAYRAVGGLIAVPERAVPFLARRLLLAAGAKEHTPESLRPVRALRALERIPTAEARQAVAILAAGPPDSPLTREARAALRYLEGNR
jgi:RNA polymerase sigma factor (sigma-70 family)